MKRVSRIQGPNDEECYVSSFVQKQVTIGVTIGVTLLISDDCVSPYTISVLSVLRFCQAPVSQTANCTG